MIGVLAQYQGTLLQLKWRRKIVRRMHKSYFHARTVYWLNGIDKNVDNVDQRMTAE